MRSENKAAAVQIDDSFANIADGGWRDLESGYAADGLAGEGRCEGGNGRMRGRQFAGNLALALLADFVQRARRRKH